MGYRIDSYTREELGKIALPGRAVSTLFWVLPVGRWRPSELDDWWNHFTRSQGDPIERVRTLKEGLTGFGPRAPLEEVACALDSAPVLNDETRQMMAFDPGSGEILVWADA